MAKKFTKITVSYQQSRIPKELKLDPEDAFNYTNPGFSESSCC
jgi:hypothetical protein